MRILQVNSVYKVGSTGKIVDSISTVLRDAGHEVFTCYGIGDAYYDGFSAKICSNAEHKVNALLARIDGIPFGGPYLSNRRVVKVIKKFHPDVVHVHCVNSFTFNIYHLLKYLANNNIKTVVTLHAEFFHTGSCGHAYDCEKWKKGCHHCAVYRQETASWFFDRSHTAWKKMFKAFQQFNPSNITITAVSPWLSKRARQSAVLGQFNVVYVPNGVNTNVFHHRTNKDLIHKEQYKKVVLFVTPCFSLGETDLKGGRYVPIMAKQHPDYKFIVVASRNERNIGDMPSNVQLWGKAKTQDELSQLYSEADATILFSKRETFSMVTAESLCCGTPVVGFKAGGPESIALQKYSSFVEYGDVQALSDTLDQCLDTTYDKSEISKKAISSYSEENMANSYFNVYKRLLK
ncbi:MAG: glycosyltransferase [Bacteroidales bacterium]|nr:glycosyltransferase [Bacteroidales bacterium]